MTNIHATIYYKFHNDTIKTIAAQTYDGLYKFPCGTLFSALNNAIDDEWRYKIYIGGLYNISIAF